MHFDHCVGLYLQLKQVKRKEKELHLTELSTNKLLNLQHARPASPAPAQMLTPRQIPFISKPDS